MANITFPITFPIWFGIPAGVSRGLHIYIDWDNDGDIDETWEDVTNDFQRLTTIRGRDSDLDRAIAGQASLSLRDTDGTYIRDNPTSPLYGVLTPGVMCQIIYVDTSDVTWWIFTGFVDDVVPDVDYKTAYIPLMDGFSEINRAYANMAIQFGKKSGQLFGYILDSIAWPSDKRRIDAGIDSYPMAFVEGETKALAVMQQVEQSEFGFLYMGTDGFLTYEDRHYRLTETRSTTSRWTCSGDKYKTIKPLAPLKGVKNYVVLECTPKTKTTGAIAPVWTLQEKASLSNSPMLAAGESRIFWAGFADANGRAQIADDVVTPVATTDYLGNASIDGTGTNRTSSLAVTALVAGTNLWASGAKITVTNNGATSVYLTKLQVRGHTFVEEGNLKITSPATPPSTNRREFRATIPFYQYSGVLQGLADHIRAVNENPNPRYEIELINKSMALTDECSQHIRERLISDRIHVESTKYGLDADCYIEKIRHEITTHGTEGLEWHTWWTVSKADANAYWILGTSALGTGTRLAY